MMLRKTTRERRENEFVRVPALGAGGVPRGDSCCWNAALVGESVSGGQQSSPGISISKPPCSVGLSDSRIRRSSPFSVRCVRHSCASESSSPGIGPSSASTVTAATATAKGRCAPVVVSPGSAIVANAILTVRTSVANPTRVSILLVPSPLKGEVNIQDQGHAWIRRRPFGRIVPP